MPVYLDEERAELMRALVGAGLGARAEEIAVFAEPCVRLATREADADSIPPGATKIGGLPDLPSGTAWPDLDGRRLAFLCQLDLASLASLLPAGALPGGGLLSFFCDGTLEAVIPPQDRPGAWRVLWSPPDAGPPRRMEAAQGSVPGRIFRSLAGRDADARSDGPEVYPACRVTLMPGLSLPGPDAPSIASLDLRPEQADTYDRIVGRLQMLAGPAHQLLGHPGPIRDQPAEECEFAAHGIVHHHTPRGDAPAARPDRAEWRLLLQLDTDDEADMAWGDAGRLYFMIRDEDLRARRFDHAWLIFQCH